ncbi:MAG: SBBP repeat-containing protein, partial [Candidatus Kapabacteria bacterium]|nr:SBBP repeat-containing protein [Candidatus Kapabacteria bacterium]
GFTKSGDFPVRNAIQQNKRLNDDAFVMRFDALGTIAWSTFLGGDLNESFRSVAFDSTSIQRPNIILTGITNSIDLPITGGYSGKAQNYDAIVASFTYDGGLIWYRLFGGTGNDEANGVAIDPDNNILLCGYTTTDDNGNFPLLGGFQPKYGGNPDGFLAKYGTGGDLQWSSYLGGDQIDNATDISVDGITNFVVVGYTSSKNFPVTAGSFQTVHGDGGTAYDGFITKVCNTAIPRAMFKDPQQPREYCKGGTTTLIATNTSSSVVYDSYLWKVRKDSTDIPVQNNTRPEFRVPPTLDSGEYKFVCLVTNSKNCPASSDTITVRINEAPTIITKPYKICKGESIQLDSVRIIGSGSYTYRWNNGKTLNDSTLRNPVSTPDTSTMYLLTVTDNKGCSNSQQLLVEVLEYPTPVITASGDTTFCIGGSVVLDAGAGFATYKWSNGAVTPTIIVSSSGVFTVDITTASGCSASSTPKRVTVHPLPSPSIIRTDDELETQRYARYQWVEGTTPVAGATNRQFVIPKPGIYSVQVTDSNGCKAQSLPFDAQIKGLASIRIGSDSASPGATVLIPVTLFSSSRLDMIQASQYKMWISWNASVLRLRGLSNTIQQTPVTITNGRAQTMLSGTRSGSSGVLTVMTFDVALGDEELSAITIDSVRWTTPSIVETTPINGTFLLTGLCKRLDTRLFRDNGTFGITMISPNPSSSESTVRFTVIEDAPTLLTLTDTEGREVSTVYSSQLAAGQYEVRFPTAAVAAGRYMIRLSSGNLLANAPLVIVR